MEGRVGNDRDELQLSYFRLALRGTAGRDAECETTRRASSETEEGEPEHEGLGTLASCVGYMRTVGA